MVSSQVTWRFSEPILPLYLTPWGRRGNSVGQQSFLPSPPSSSTPFDFSCLKQPCPSSSPLSKELDLHGFWIYHFSIISTIGLTPCPFNARKSSWQKWGLGPSEPSPVPLYSCLCYGFCFSWGTLDVKIICIFYCIIWRQGLTLGGRGKKNQANQ